MTDKAESYFLDNPHDPDNPEECGPARRSRYGSPDDPELWENSLRSKICTPGSLICVDGEWMTVQDLKWFEEDIEDFVTIIGPRDYYECGGHKNLVAPVIYKSPNGGLYYYCQDCAEKHGNTITAIQKAKIKYLEHPANPHAKNMKRIYKIINGNTEVVSIACEDGVSPTIGETYRLLADDFSTGASLLEVYRALKYQKAHEHDMWHPLDQEFRLRHADWMNGVLLTENQKLHLELMETVTDLMDELGDEFVVTIDVLVNVLGRRAATIKRVLDQMVEDGILTRHEGSRGAQYCLKGRHGRRTTATKEVLEEALSLSLEA
jgi:hypothetical protein